MLCCYYPTTIVAIDDNVDFLATMDHYLGFPNFQCYTSPEEAFKFITREETVKRLQEKLHKTTFEFSENTNSLPEEYAVVVNVKNLHEEIYSYNRFHDVSVLIIDYYMEGVNGIDVCKKLANHPAKKILLTGGLDTEKIAIEAFNNGIIHRFINKADFNFPNQLRQAIAVLQEAFFQDLTSKLIDHIPTCKILQNPAYINFTTMLRNKVHAVEYYLLDTAGSMLYLDESGNPTWLIIKKDQDIENYAQIAFDAESPEPIIQALKNRQKLPFFFTKSDYEKPTTHWNDYLYEANKFPGIPDCYYSIMPGHIRANLDKNSLLSYMMFTENES